MKVVFLAGGVGKRMLPITKEKSLLKFLGKELILHQIEWAEKAGFKEFVVIGNPLNISTFKEIIGDKAEYAVQLDPKGMADALLAAKNLLKGSEILIANPNDTIEVSAYEAVLKQEGQVVMLAQEVTEYFPGGYLDVDENDKVKRIVEKPGKGNEPSNLVNIVLHLHRNSDELFGYLESTTSAKDDVYETAIQRMINNQIDVRVARYKGFWSAIKYPHHILNIFDELFCS